MKWKMNEEQVIDFYEEYYLPGVKEQYEQDGIIDGPARREAFNNMVDGLHRDDVITDEIVNSICLPDRLDN